MPAPTNYLDYDAIFTAYYTQFRADSDVPINTDDEYTVGLRLANEAINYWANYEGTYWRELFTTNQTDGSGAQTIVTAQRTYAGPTNFREAGGMIQILDTNGSVLTSYNRIEPHEAQFKSDNAPYAFFTADPSSGWTLHLNPAPQAALNGKDIEYVYYKTPTLLSTGTSKTEMSNPYFIVHRILANQYRAARNPYYASALEEADNLIKGMQLDNNSGSWDNPPSLNDTSGSVWGV